MPEMLAVTRLKRILVSLPDLELRVAWLRSGLERAHPAHSAPLLDALCEDAERSDPSAREAVLALGLLFAGLGECELLERLREEAAGRKLLSLDRLLRR